MIAPALASLVAMLDVSTAAAEGGVDRQIVNVDIRGQVAERCELTPFRIAIDESNSQQTQYLQCNYPASRMIKFAGRKSGMSTFVMEPGK